jgi:hypothetical protein
MKHESDGLTASSQSNGVTSRRAEPRFAPPKELHCAIRGFSSAVAVEDISIGGMALTCDVPISRTAVHEVHLTLGRMTIERRARAVHCRRGDDGRWRIGLAFMPAHTTGPTIENLVDLITRSLIDFS